MSSRQLFFWVISARRGLLAGLLVCAAGVAAAELAIPWLSQAAIDAALERFNAARLDRLGLLMLGVIAAWYLLHAALLGLESRVLYNGLFRLRQHLYDHVLRQPLAFFNRSRSGELVHRVVSDTGVFEDHAAELFSDLPFELLTVAGVLTLMVVTNLPLALLVVGFLLVASAVSWYVGRPLRTIRKSLQTVGAAFSARLQEALAGIRTVKAFGRERDETRRLDEANRRLLHLEVREGWVEALLVPVFEIMEVLGLVVVVWYGAHLILAKRITPGGLVAFIVYMEILAGPVSRAGNFYRHFQQCRAVSERLASFLSDGEPAPVVITASRPALIPGELWAIAFENVRFDYPGTQRPALQDVSLTVKVGEAIAIVGRNGAGKSTLMDLLLRFYDPTAGSITVGSIDLRAWDLDRWREAVGIMSQDVFLFHATVAENIAYGRPAATPEEIEASALEAGLGDLIARLPAGLATVVGDRGNRLSGGERQRIALARLFLKKPAVLIFDEPTAHLDGEALTTVGEAMARLARGRTTFVVAHRPETIQLAERVVVLDGGRIIAEGRHDALLAAEPLYRSLLASWARDRGRRQRSGDVAREAPVA